MKQFSQSMGMLFLFAGILLVSCKKENPEEDINAIITHNVYFVAPDGDDDNPGTRDQPWATWEKAFNMDTIHAGDTIYFRGGVYDYTKTEGGYGYPCTTDGVKDHFVHYFNYPGEKPILDCIHTVPSGTLNLPLYMKDVNYVHFKGLTVRNVKQHKPTDEVMTWTIGGSNVIVENCVTHDSHGIGFRTNVCYDIYYVNCDSYNHCDSLTTEKPGNDGSGYLDFNTTDPATTAYYINCRAWNCGDQGFSSGSIGSTTYEGCWSWENGILEGGGHGFKMGWIPEVHKNVIHRKYWNCIAAFNRKRGWDSNDVGYESGTFEVFNNTAYANNRGFYVFNTDDSNSNERNREYRNNLAFGNIFEDAGTGDGADYTHSNNSWDSPVTVSEADFISLSPEGMKSERKPDGSLPDLEGFLKLAEESDLIDAGMDVGLPFNGSAPDIGADETSF